MEKVKVQIAVLGAGIAGLWTHHTLRSLGFNSVLITKDTIGGKQTLASQGMIHGGQRYTLQGVLNDHSESISAMPAIWDNCLKGKSSPNLSSAKVLSNNQHLFSSGGIGSNVTAFFASKAMNSRVSALEQEKWPEIFKAAPKFKGSIYEMSEVVLDIQTLTKALAAPFIDSIYKAENISYETDSSLKALYLKDQQHEIELSADLYIFTAAEGNEEIAARFGFNEKVAQRRPLKQIMVKDLPYPLYAHCITTDPRPRVTISSHPSDNGYIWYLGGLVATQGVSQSDSEAIQFAKTELTQLFPWIDWSAKEWACCYIDRAEPYAASGFLPDGPALREISNTVLAWPTKLTFAPALSHKITELLSHKKITPDNKLPTKLPFSAPLIGNYPWENTTWMKL